MPKTQKVGENFLVNNGNVVSFSGVRAFCVGFESPFIGKTSTFMRDRLDDTLTQILTQRENEITLSIYLAPMEARTLEEVELRQRGFQHAEISIESS